MPGERGNTMSRKRKAKSRKPQPPPRSPDQGDVEMPGVRQWYWGQFAVCLLTAILLIAMVWAISRPIGDFYVGLAAGRDMVQSRLACLKHNDTWSFLTTNRPWFNQNWGTHLVCYLAYSCAKDGGALVLKATILLVMATGITLA